MMDLGGDDRRDFFRVSETLRIESRPISSTEALALGNRLATDRTFSGNLLSAGRTWDSDDVRECLQALDRKLDLIIDLLSGSNSQFERKHVEVDVSGSGIRFESDIFFEEGVFLELRIGVLSSSGGDVRAVGEVVRSRVADAERKVWEIAVRFVAVSERDRDTLVRHIFSRQRQQTHGTREPATSD
jgi:hypothetical protein